MDIHRVAIEPGARLLLLIFNHQTLGSQTCNSKSTGYRLPSKTLRLHRLTPSVHSSTNDKSPSWGFRDIYRNPHQDNTYITSVNKYSKSVVHYFSIFLRGYCRESQHTCNPNSPSVGLCTKASRK